MGRPVPRAQARLRKAVGCRNLVMMRRAVQMERRRTVEGVSTSF